MPEIGFYHLTQSPLDAVLPRPLEKAYGQGHRIVVRADDATLLKELDALLWTYDEASFLPHGLASDEHAASQPILLTTAPDAPNGADVLVMIGGDLPDDIDRFARTLYLFEDSDAAVLAAARRQWTALKGRENLTRSYWQQDERGRWKKT